MSFKDIWLDYGEVVPGYDIRVLNEREARAAAGILGMLGTLVLFIAIGFGHVIVARVYLSYLFFEFILRVFNPRYAPLFTFRKIYSEQSKT